MYQHLTKLLLAGVVAVILSAAPADAFHKGSIHGGTPPGEDPPIEIQTLDSLACTAGQIARFVGGVWDCSDVLADLQTQMDNLALLSSRQASAFIFVTSSEHLGDFGVVLGGITFADAECNALAVTAGLPGFYKAWLADLEESSAPASIFFQAPGPYILPDGTLVAANWTQLTSGTLSNEISVDESGVYDASLEVWTNVRLEGIRHTLDPLNICGNWTDTTKRGYFGLTEATDFNWTTTALSIDCNQPRRFYCVGQ